MIAHHRAIRYWLSSCRRGWLHPSWLPLQVRNSSSFAFYFLLNCSPCAKCKARPFAAITRRCVRRKNRAKRLPNFYRLLTPWTVKGVQSCFQRSRVPSSKWWAGVPIIWHVIAVDAADICQHQGDREDSAPVVRIRWTEYGRSARVASAPNAIPLLSLISLYKNMNINSVYMDAVVRNTWSSGSSTRPLNRPP